MNAEVLIELLTRTAIIAINEYAIFFIRVTLLCVVKYVFDTNQTVHSRSFVFPPLPWPHFVDPDIVSLDY